MAANMVHVRKGAWEMGTGRGAERGTVDASIPTGHHEDLVRNAARQLANRDSVLQPARLDLPAKHSCHYTESQATNVLAAASSPGPRGYKKAVATVLAGTAFLFAPAAIPSAQLALLRQGDLAAVHKSLRH